MEIVKHYRVTYMYLRRYPDITSSRQNAFARIGSVRIHSLHEFAVADKIAFVLLQIWANSANGIMPGEDFDPDLPM